MKTTREWVVVRDYLVGMDVAWFKKQQRIAGVTAEDIADKLGRDRSLVSRIYVGRQAMTIDQAKVFAEVLGQPVAEVLQRAGIEVDLSGAGAGAGADGARGFAEGDAAPWVPKGADDRRMQAMAEAAGQRPGVDVWRVGNTSMAGAGFLPGDYMLIDTHSAERVSPGDTVIAQVYARNGTARTVLRRWVPPVLVSVGCAAEPVEAHVVDHDNVVIRGKVVASWRI